MNTIGNTSGSIVSSILSVCFVFLAAMYLSLFSTFAYQLYQFEKKLGIADKVTKVKYIGLVCGIVAFAVFVAAIFF